MTASAMSPADKELVQKSWAVVMQNRVANQKAIYIAMFAKHPEYLPLFSKLKDMNMDEIKASARLEGLAMNFSAALDNIIIALTNDAVWDDLMERLALSHYQKPLNDSHFQNVFDCVLEVLKDHDATKTMSDPGAAVAAWKAFFDEVRTQTMSRCAKLQG